MSVIRGFGFHARRGQAIQRGDLCEALVLTALHSVFSEDWQIDPQWSFPAKEPVLRDAFDFMIYRVNPNDRTILDAIILQVTSYREGENVVEEPNKTYEFFETLEEFTYLLSRVRTLPGLPPLPLKTKFAHVLFGNKRYVRKWVPTHQEAVFDFCLYPHYDDYEQYSSQPVYPLLAGIADGELDLYRVAARIESLARSGTLDRAVQTQLTRLVSRLRTYRDAGLPTNPGADLVLNARREYLNSQEYLENLNFLREQLKHGRPADRPSIKRQFLEGIEPTLPAEWKKGLENVKLTLGRRRPEFTFGKAILKEYSKFAAEFAENLAKGRRSHLLSEWNNGNIGRRKFMRMLLIQLGGLHADSLYSKEVTEQNLSSKVFSGAETNEILSKVLAGMEKSAGTLIVRSKMEKYVTSRKDYAQALVSYIEKNGTTNKPDKEFLEYLISRAMSDGRIPRSTQTERTFSSYLVDYVFEAKHRLRTFPEHGVKGLGDACTFHAEFAFRKKDGTMIFIKSKYTDAEERRRAKEEGQKGWLGKLRYEHKNEMPKLTTDGSKQFWILLDGNWAQIPVMEHLVECGWRVYLDPFELVQELCLCLGKS